MKVFTKIHTELMEYSHKFGETESQLMGLFDEILSEMSASEFNDKPLGREYLIGYYKQGNELNNIISVQEAADMWGLSPIMSRSFAGMAMCRQKIGKTWAVLKNQENPKQRGRRKMTNFKTVGTWWADKDIELVEIDGKVYALNGWNGEKHTDCWECVGEDKMEASEERYEITPITEEVEGEFETVGYEVI